MKKAISLVAAAGIFLSAVAPSYAFTLNIKNNGFDSTNKIMLLKKKIKSMSQTNTTSTTNMIDISANTGNNEANKNTGADVDVDTGDVTTTVVVTNGGNTNIADTDDCGCDDDSDDAVVVQKNGAESKNEVEVKWVNKFMEDQFNISALLNAIAGDLKTGNNEANKNTDGDDDLDEVSVNTGTVTVGVSITNEGDTNVLGGGI